MLLQMAWFYSFFMNESYSVVYTCHSFFIHSCRDGYLGCFHVLDIGNSTAMNTGMCVSFFFLDRCPGVGLLDYTVVLCLVFFFFFFWITSLLFSILIGQTYIPTNSVRGFPLDGLGVWDRHMHTVVYGITGQQGPAFITQGTVQYSVIIYMRIWSEKEWICVYV